MSVDAVVYYRKTSIHLSIYKYYSIHLSIYMFIYLFIHSFIYLYIYLFISKSIRTFICINVKQSFYSKNQMVKKSSICVLREFCSYMDGTLNKFDLFVQWCLYVLTHFMLIYIHKEDWFKGHINVFLKEMRYVSGKKNRLRWMNVRRVSNATVSVANVENAHHSTRSVLLIYFSSYLSIYKSI